MVRWLAQSNHAGLARAQMLDDSLDCAVLTAGVPALENDQDPVVMLDDVPLHLDQLDLQVVHCSAVILSEVTGLTFRFPRCFRHRSNLLLLRQR